MLLDYRRIPTGVVSLAAAAARLWVLAAVAAAGCRSGFDRIDHRVQELISESSQRLGEDAYPPRPGAAPTQPPSQVDRGDSTQHVPPTVNPSARELTFTPREEADDVLRRLESYAEPPEHALLIDLFRALEFATLGSREYRFAEEEYVLSALRLLIERHLWGPRFFNDTSALVSGSGDDGFFDSSLSIVNEFVVTQRLPYGGEISARALARATEDLHSRVAGEDTQDAEIILQAGIPLLRGAGIVARESRIQAERDLIYSAREFEQFRREFFFEIAQDFLNLVVQQQSVENAERQVRRLQEVAEREIALYEAGRTPRFEAALAEQGVVQGLDNLNARRESYQLALDRFKVRLGLPISQPVAIVPSSIDLPIPHTSMEDAVQKAIVYRLDLQTQRDRVNDARRDVANARNDLLPDLDVTAATSIPTDRDRRRGGLRFRPGQSDYQAGLTFGWPLDREIERLNVRQAQINLEREIREHDQLRDLIAVSVRSAVRDIDRAQYRLAIQDRSVEIGLERKASIDAAPDRATARDRSEAADELLQAQDARDEARRDLQVAVLQYLLETGQLRVRADGVILPLAGMTVNQVIEAQQPPANDPNGALEPDLLPPEPPIPPPQEPAEPAPDG